MNLFAQQPNFSWAHSIGDEYADQGTSIAIDSDGYIYSTGSFQGSVDFDPSSNELILTSNGLTGVNSALDIFVTKTSSTGELIWAKNIGGSGNDNGAHILVDENGYIYITGSFHGTVDFNTGTGTASLTSLGNSDVYTLKLDNNGDFIWVKHFGGTGDNEGIANALDDEGNIYVIGAFQATINADIQTGSNVLTSLGNDDTFIVKLSNEGNVLWAKQFGGIDYVQANAVAVDSDENVYIAGGFRGTVDINPGAIQYNKTSAPGNYEIFLTKLTANGEFVWAEQFGGPALGMDVIYDMTIDMDGNIYATGTFQETIDFDPSTNTNELTAGIDAFILKLTSSGEFVWANQIGSSDYSGFATGRGIFVNNQNQVFTTGHFQGTVNFDLSANDFELTSFGNYDIYITQLNADGSFAWVKQAGGSNIDIGYDIATDSNGNIYTIGVFQDNADFNPENGGHVLNSNGLSDIFLQKLGSCIATGIDTHQACGEFTWIDGNTYTTSNSTATFTIPNGASTGCDSIVTLNLTVNNLPDNSVSITSNTLSANYTGGSYQWLDCNNNFSIVPDATSNSFTPDNSGSYAVIINDGTCQDTSSCFQLNLVGFQEIETPAYSISPNPFNQHFSINFKTNHAKINFKVYDPMGRLVLTKELTNVHAFECEIDGSSGIYFIELDFYHGVIDRQIIIKQ
jgi:uncharacterized protein (AIM24 family)